MRRLKRRANGKQPRRCSAHGPCSTTRRRCAALAWPPCSSSCHSGCRRASARIAASRAAREGVGCGPRSGRCGCGSGWGGRARVGAKARCARRDTSARDHRGGGDGRLSAVAPGQRHTLEADGQRRTIHQAEDPGRRRERAIGRRAVEAKLAPPQFGLEPCHGLLHGQSRGRVPAHRVDLTCAHGRGRPHQARGCAHRFKCGAPCLQAERLRVYRHHTGLPVGGQEHRGSKHGPGDGTDTGVVDTDHGPVGGRVVSLCWQRPHAGTRCTARALGRGKQRLLSPARTTRVSVLGIHLPRGWCTASGTKKRKGCRGNSAKTARPRGER